MCGRFTLTIQEKAIVEHFDIHSHAINTRQLSLPRYNIAPTQDVAVIRMSLENRWRELAAMHWGLIPSWIKDPTTSKHMINARCETIDVKPTYRAALKRRRCLIPASGFYEWKQLGKTKRPYYIHRFDKAPFAFAGLWEHWAPSNREDPEIESCTIITTSANKMMRELHDRMPVIVAPENYHVWLDPDIQDPQSVLPLLVPPPDDELVAYPVSTRVNNPKHDDVACLEGQQELF